MIYLALNPSQKTKLVDSMVNIFQLVQQDISHDIDTSALLSNTVAQRLQSIVHESPHILGRYYHEKLQEMLKPELEQQSFPAFALADEDATVVDLLSYGRTYNLPAYLKPKIGDLFHTIQVRHEDVLRVFVFWFNTLGSLPRAIASVYRNAS